ncbi:hypothetical protein [Paracoccus methylarcula]|uniref:Sulfotransferase family protein n=1 Tax=Paracoccus methylarcula TaxID=72022 RepID=A0A422QV44_9RHOB|nr:hypothetical protein [Paracoccus methylarcula]RNF33741.1 hypothetical protein A7A09_014775 [Paracoccus methylarcula]
MKLVIFIGHFKTGSTSIQSFLSSNYLRLLRAGILYPSVESKGISRNLRAAVSGKDIPTLGESLNIIEPHNALALRLKNEEDKHGIPPYYPALPSGFQMLEMIENQISDLNPHSAIICSEVFALLGLTEQRKSIERLAARFGRHDVTIYCNLRRPDDYISSWHRQRLKFGAKLDRLHDGALDQYLDSAHFQQAKMIDGWVKDHFSNARLIIRNYDDVMSAGGAVKDFINNSEIIFPKNITLPENQNPSIPCAFAELGRRCLHDLPREEARRLVSWLSSAKARQTIPHVPDSQVEMFGPKYREVLLNNFRPVAESLNEMTQTYPFYQEVEDFGRCRPVPEIEAANEALPKLVRIAKLQGLPETVLEWLNDWKF